MYIVFDIGGTNTRVASFTDFKNIKEINRFKTPKSLAKGFIKIIESIESMQVGKLEGLVLALPGVIDRKNGKIQKCPNLSNWENKNLKKKLINKFKCPVYLVNDADLAGLGEAVFGAGKRHNLIAYLSLGTGVGGTRIINKKIDEFYVGFEPGHQISLTDKRVSWESLVGGKAFFKKYKVLPEDCQDSKIWIDWNKNLALGILNLIVFWSPELIILGGRLSENKIHLPILKKELDKNLKIFKTPLIKKSQLKDKAALYGAMAFIKNKYDK
jgi:glucokinase